jgi:hypothetical protein
MPTQSLPMLGEVPRKRVASDPHTGETLCKPLAEEFKPLIGRAIERCILLSGMTKQEAAYEMGYTDASALSRWIAGVEQPQLHRLFSVRALQPFLIVALGQMCKDVVITTNVSVRMTA